ncbi:MAG: histidine kinase dimerization/phosphoacceptor domain -containing protein [Roseovarius sp.]
MSNDPPPLKTVVQDVPVEFDLSDRISSRMSSKLSAFGGQILVAVLCTLGAIVVREMTDLILPAGAGPFALTFPFVLFATLFARWTAGVITMLLSALFAWYFVLPVNQSFTFEIGSDGPRVFVNVLSGFAIVALAEYYRRVVRQAVSTRDTLAEDRKLLLQEIDHRVKNKFAMVAGLVRIEARSAGSDEARQALNRLLGRVDSIAKVHEALYRDEDGDSRVDMRAYLSLLCNSLRDGVVTQDGIQVVTDLRPVDLPRDKAIAVGLVVNELFTNAVKHAFKGRESGEIRVLLDQEGSALVVTVADDGVGMDGAETREGSLGQGLLQNFAESAEGELEYPATETGTCVRLRIPM